MYRMISSISASVSTDQQAGIELFSMPPLISSRSGPGVLMRLTLGDVKSRVFALTLNIDPKHCVSLNDKSRFKNDSAWVDTYIGRSNYVSER
jgi:hypothetical protein